MGHGAGHCLKGRALFAVLRGIRPAEAIEVGAALVDAGVTVLEVTLNSPDPFASIECLANRYGDSALIGAGTVTTAEQVPRVLNAGGALVVSPNTDLSVIHETKALGLTSLPGCFTPSEALTALKAGADGLKLFPAGCLPPEAVRAARAALPEGARVFLVGGISTSNVADYVAAGADGFGVGSAIYRPGKSIENIARDARAIVQAFRDAIHY